MKIIVLFEAQVWKEDSSNCPFSLFSHFLWALWPLFLFFIFILVGIFGLFFVNGLRWPLLFPHMGQCSINNDHHTYNSILRAMMTLYEMPSVVYHDNDLA